MKRLTEKRGDQYFVRANYGDATRRAQKCER